MFIEKKGVLLHPQIAIVVDLVAQQVEHHTFNVGVLGSSPSQVTKKDVKFFDILFSFINYQLSIINFIRGKYIRTILNGNSRGILCLLPR